jgi:sugar lactone lactonase YvrE
VGLRVLEAEPDELGEGPIWAAREQALYWVDVVGCRVRRRGLAGDERRWELPGEVGCLVLGGAGSALVTLSDGVHRLVLEGGALTHLGDPLPDPRTAYNDGACDSTGRFWFAGFDNREREPLSGLFSLDPDGSFTCHDTGYVVGNGIGFSLDETTLYATDSGRRSIFAYDLDVDRGLARRRRAFATDPRGAGVPDGLAVDVEGRVWSAKWDGCRITRYRPDGTIEAELRLPVRRPTNLAFGGPSGTTAYVTTARYGLVGSAAEPPAGSLLAFEAGVTGAPVHRFASG